MKKSIDIYSHIWYNVFSEKHSRYQIKHKINFQNILKKVLTTDSENGIMSTVKAAGKQSLTADETK